MRVALLIPFLFVGAEAATIPAIDSARGEKLFQYLACANCHRTDQPGRCPNLQGMFGTGVQLTTGETVKADEAYIRESILNPSAKIVAGYQNIMPSFQGQVTEEDLLQLIEYIKSLKTPSRNY
jgi:cytochrome c oxidase subunit 2